MVDPVPAGLVRVSWTGKGEVERCPTIPITTAPGGKPIAVISFGQGKDLDTSLPSLQAGDRLEVGAEIEVTTDLTNQQATENKKLGGRPVGTPYDYEPAVSAQLILASQPDEVVAGKGRGIAIGPPLTIKKLSHAQHHAVFVFDGAKTNSVIDIPKTGLPWRGPSFVDLVLSASNGAAKAGNVLLIGQNEFDGSITQDMGAICAVRFRPAEEVEPKPTSIQKVISTKLSMATEAKKVIYSMPLDRLTANEQLRIRAHVDTSMKGIPFPARVKVRAFLAESPIQLEPSEGGTLVADAASSRGQVTKGNGFNTMAGGTATYSKVGVLRMLRTVDKKLFLNVVASAGNPDKVLKPTDVAVLGTGFLAVTRYPPSCCG